MALLSLSPISKSWCSSFRACHIPVFRLDLASILEDPNIDEQVSGWLETPSEIDVSPLSLISCQQVSVLSDIIFLLRTQAARPTVLSNCPGHIASSRPVRPDLLPGQVDDICAPPDKVFQFVRPGSVVRKQAAFVPAHGQMVRQQRAGYALIRIGIERALERLQNVGNIAV